MPAAEPTTDPSFEVPTSEAPTAALKPKAPPVQVAPPLPSAPARQKAVPAASPAPAPDAPVANAAGAAANAAPGPASDSGPSRPSAPPNQALPDMGTALSGRYLLKQVLGQGAAAIVYQATDTVLDQTVAVKVLLLDGLCANNLAKEIGVTLRSEAVAAMKLSHPGILRVFNYERDDPWEFIVMEFVVGEALSEYQKKQPEKRLSADETVRWGIECSKALAYAHAQGIVHHDIKPHNIMLTRTGRIKLCDFGLARMAGMAWKQGYNAGTPAFLSPERASGGEGDHRSDLYSLAATLYVLGNGRTLFGSKPEAAIKGHCFLPVPASPHLPDAIHAVLERALQKDPKDRFQSAREMGEALQRASATIASEPTVEEGASVIGWSMAVQGHPTPVHLEAQRPSGSAVQPQQPPPLRLELQRPPAEGPPRPVKLVALPSRSGADNPSPPAQANRKVELLRPPEPAEEPPSRPRPVEPEPLRAVPPPLRLRAITRPRRPDDMVLVEACEVISAYGGTYPVEAFSIDRTPVTNEQYLAFVKDTGAPAPAHWRKGAPPRDQLRHPVVGITLNEARRYADHVGRRLPSCLEWEAAARSPDGRAFPWGEDWDPSRCHCPEQSQGDTAPVGRYAQGASPAGCLDLVGNTWEWTELDPRVEPQEPGSVWVFGGSFCHSCAKDGAIARTSISQRKSYLYLGFRCALGEKEEP